MDYKHNERVAHTHPQCELGHPRHELDGDGVKVCERPPTIVVDVEVLLEVVAEVDLRDEFQNELRDLVPLQERTRSLINLTTTREITDHSQLMSVGHVDF